MEGLEAAHLRLDRASGVVSRPALRECPAVVPARAQGFISGNCCRAVLFPRSSVLADGDDKAFRGKLCRGDCDGTSVHVSRKSLQNFRSLSSKRWVCPFRVSRQSRISCKHPVRFRLLNYALTISCLDGQFPHRKSFTNFAAVHRGICLSKPTLGMACYCPRVSLVNIRPVEFKPALCYSMFSCSGWRFRHAWMNHPTGASAAPMRLP
jgi:hypothetical protein